MKQLVILALFSIATSQPDQLITGYLIQNEESFCMDECGDYYIETFGDMYWPVVFNDTIDNIHLYIDRYVEVFIGQEIDCIECSAFQIESISISDECIFIVDCFADPCLVAEECQIFTPTECVSNYCGGCYADFYDLNGNLVDCNQPIEDCDDIEENYIALHSGEYAVCEYDIDCMPVWGHCDVSLGGCHYAVNTSNYPEDEINEVVDLWVENGCMTAVCDCMDLPYAVCLSGECSLAYCSEPNPAGCSQTGCPEGYECIYDGENCTASSCYCNESYDFWGCTEDCGGGTCLPEQNIEECNDPYIEIEGHCFHQDDIAALQDMINNSIDSGLENSPNIYMDGENWHEVIIDGEYYQFSNSNGIVEPLELGIQEWENGRLTSLMCGSFIYCDLSGEIPASISNLEEINVLRLEVNYFSGFVPESICDYEHLDYEDYLAFNLSYNQLCPPYPECVPTGAVEYMEISNCYQQGDLNNDLEINVIDIVLLVSFILMIDEPTESELYAGDVNGDDALNVLDIVAIVQMILNPIDEDCYIEPEVGPCDGICPTYFYNQDTNECEEFITGCCGVEAFNTMESCINTCE